jgi:hypothetical protein
MKLPLSDALRIGERLAHPDPYQNEPIIRALKGQGALPHDLTDKYAWEPGVHLNISQATAYPNEALCKIHPWLHLPVLCPWCATPVKGGEIVAHPAAEHDQEIGYEEHCDWISDLEAEPDMRTMALAVYFPSRVERLRILEMARAQHMSSHRFLAAAARLVLEYGLKLVNFVEVE